MFYTKKKYKFIKITLIFLISALFGISLGYLSTRYESFPFYDRINQNAQSKEHIEKTEIPESSPIPIYASLSENNKIEAPSSPPKKDISKKFLYIVKAENTKVYLFKTDESGNILEKQPLPINLNALLSEDKKLLSDGITITSKKELASILEDFGS